VTQLGGYFRGALHRRIFFWFGASILIAIITSTLVTWIAGGLGEPGWRREIEGGRNFLRWQFARVWDSPAERDEMAREISQSMEADVVLVDQSGRILASFGNPCRRAAISMPIEKEGRPVGSVRICLARHRLRAPWRLGLSLLLIAAVLWAASGAIARRLARPLWEISRVAQDLGTGKLSSRASILRRDPGEVRTLAQSINDMADRIEKQMADQRVLLAAVSHELRTPLARVRLLVELARENGTDAKTLDELEREVIEIDRLVGELLASSRLDFAALRPLELDAVEVAERALERAGADSAVLRVETSSTRFLGDATLIARALANLVDNAGRHGGGLVCLRIKERPGFIAFEAEDAGPGFAQGDEERVFQAFYRGSRQGRSDAGSLGLGLALVRRIAQAHGGSAYAVNRPGGRGACVGFEVKAGAVSEAEGPARP
jgi:two-component system OmpR family sensor kinase